MGMSEYLRRFSSGVISSIHSRASVGGNVI